MSTDVLDSFNLEAVSLAGERGFIEVYKILLNHAEEIQRLFGGIIYDYQTAIPDIIDHVYDGKGLSVEGMILEPASKCFSYLKKLGLRPKSVGQRPAKLDQNHQGVCYIEVL